METFKELTSRTWKDYEAVMGEKGGCGGCWCMSWRIKRKGKDWQQNQGEPNKRAMKRLVNTRKAFGIIAYDNGEPVGWCSFGPKKHYPRLAKAKAYLTADAAKVWSAPCFLVRKDKRGKGLSARILEQVAIAAKERGARILEGYPATRTKAGAKLPAAFVWTGPEAIFQRCGFKEVQRLSWSRPLYRKIL